jgi:outer membrane protease
MIFRSIRLQTAVCALLLISCAGLYGNIFKADIETGASRSFSSTLYQIGGKVKLPNGTTGNTNFPISELKFPANIYVGYVNVKGTFIDRITVNARFIYNFNKIKSGTMIDTDWDIYSSPVAQSHSEAILNTLHTVDVDITYRVVSVRFFSLNIGAGFMYQYFNYDIENLAQWDLFTPGVLTSTTRAGLVLTYNIKYYMPYLSLSPCFNIQDRFFISIKFAVSPYPVGIDRDNHLLRTKLNTGKANGVAIIASIDFEYHIVDSVFLSLECAVNQIYAWGQQKQYWYGTWDLPTVPGSKATIENRLESTQVYISLGAGISVSF